MKGLIHKAVALVAGTAVLAGVGCYTCNSGTCAAGGPGAGCAGCGGVWNLYDRCYPQRYQYLACREVDAAFAPQVQNGHVLDQTVWNYHFVPCTDCLTPAGLEHLAYIARRRPQPDTTVYVQTSNDVAYDPAHPDQLAANREGLDAKRVQAVQKFLVAHTAGRPADFHVFVHDPADVSLAAVPVNLAVTQMYFRYRGGLGGVGGGGAGAAGAGAAAGMTTGIGGR
jgi:hypothetical protein